MDQQNPDQRWQQIQANIESFLNQNLTNNIQSIEYKPRFIALLEMSSEHHQNDFQETGGF
jgi:3-methyladenine DNA glycosylase/8-oxoguanine DNA glycosylase